jgi:hypothetical protein
VPSFAPLSIFYWPEDPKIMNNTYFSIKQNRNLSKVDVHYLELNSCGVTNGKYFFGGRF